MLKNTSSILNAITKQSNVEFTWDTAEALVQHILNFGLERRGSASQQLSCSTHDMNLSL